MEFEVNREGQIVVRKSGARSGRARDRFDAARGKAQVKWRTDELMALLRGPTERRPVLLVDTNVLIDVLEDDPTWADWSVRQLRAQAQVHELCINPVIYSELSLVFDSVKAADETIDSMNLVFHELPRPALFLAGRAFVKYRRESGTRTNVPADFFIGAHAAVTGCGILTRDDRRYQSYFATVALVTPESA